MPVSHYRHREEQEGVPFGRELIVRGAEERLVPILMTACATALALLLIVVGGNRPGHEIEHPMAVVILGGLLTSPALNLFVMPTLSLRYAKDVITGGLGSLSIRTPRRLMDHRKSRLHHYAAKA